jgi:hypothetical protein
MAQTWLGFDPDFDVARFGGEEVTVRPATLVSRTDLSAAGQALGKPLPAVIGTGRVDGNYFIGGVEQIETVTTTESYSWQDITEYQGGIWAQNITRGGNTFGTGGSYIEGPLLPVYTRNVTETVSTQTVTIAGYVLAYDYFERGYDLIRLEVDGTVVFDAENNVGAQTTFRFYGGQHDSQDEILTEIIGDNAGAYKNFVMLFLDGFPADSPPSVSAVISNAPDTTPDSVETITGDYNNSVWWPQYGTYDLAQGLIYQFVYAVHSSHGMDMMHVLSIESLTEISRFAWPSVSIPDPINFLILPGTQYMLAVSQEIDAPYEIGVVDMTSGHALVVEVPSGSKPDEAVTFTCAINASNALPGTWLALGTYLTTHVSPTDDANSCLAVFNTAAGSLTLIDIPTAYDYASYACPGQAGSGTTSFFVVEWEYSKSELQNNRIVELIYNGVTVTPRLVYTVPAGYARGVAYSASTGYLAVPVRDGTNYSIHVVNTAGVLIREIETAVAFDLLMDNGWYCSNRLYPAQGSVLFYDHLNNEVWALNLNTFTLVRFADYSYNDPAYGLYDQTHNIWMEDIYPDDSNGYWAVHQAATAVPGLIDLQDIVTDAMSLAGFGSADLTFSGFTGLTSYGFVIAADTTIQTVVRSIADIYGFSWCDTGSGFYFKKAGQGDALTVDAAMTSADIVERPQPVNSLDEGDIRTPSALEMEYQSKEGGYKSRPASFSMTTGVLNSITTPRFSTPILMADAEAQRIVTEKFFEYQEKRRVHDWIAAPEHCVLLPGDIVSVPSGTITYTTRIEGIGIDLRSMGVEISARDFQTEAETTITSVSNAVPVWRAVYLASRYIHLDVPLLQYAHDQDGAALVQYGFLGPRSQELLWSGARLDRGPLPTALGAIYNQSPHQGVTGVCTTVLAAPVDPFALDDDSTVTIRDARPGMLFDRTEAEVLSGRNNAYIGAPGRWEWVGFKDVTDNGDGTYTLSGFSRRGYRGSEVFCGTHEVGDLFVLVNFPWVRSMLHPVDDLGETLYYRAVGNGQNPAAAPILPHVITGTAETPYACLNLDAAEATPDGIDISWDYRSRIAEGLNPANFGEAALEFEIDIYDTDGTTWLRTLTSTTNSVHYATADVVADFGADPPSDLHFRVFMMSALPILVAGQDRPVEGRGYEARGYKSFAPATVDTSTLTADTILHFADES